MKKIALALLVGTASLKEISLGELIGECPEGKDCEKFRDVRLSQISMHQRMAC